MVLEIEQFYLFFHLQLLKFILKKNTIKLFFWYNIQNSYLILNPDSLDGNQFGTRLPFPRYIVKSNIAK